MPADNKYCERSAPCADRFYLSRFPINSEEADKCLPIHFQTLIFACTTKPENRTNIFVMDMNVKLTDAQKKALVQSPDSIVPVMQQILLRENKMGRSQEHFWVVGLNNANKVLFIELIALGRQNRVAVPPPDVFRMAIYKLALKVILVHNHPSGNLTPSAADKAFTDRILKVGEIIHIDVLDHIIITENSYYSFMETGLMDQMRAIDTWRVIERDEWEIKQLKLEIEKKQTQKNAKLEVAGNLKKEGMDEATIRKVTGLKLAEIRKL